MQLQKCYVQCRLKGLKKRLNAVFCAANRKRTMYMAERIGHGA